MNLPVRQFNDQEILQARGLKNRVSEQRPYAFLNEVEPSASGKPVETSTLFLTNRECPFRCLMCDLWQNTTDESISVGSIPRQIQYALNRLPAARQIKLYNSGNFFDAKAIPREDWPAIAELVETFERVIVENHPLLCNESCTDFQKQIAGQLEIALGLETIHPEVLPALNKRMTLDDFARAAEFLRQHEIEVRAFILLKPPFLEESEGVAWAIRSVEYAFSLGVGCCAVIPTRPGNGMLELLQSQGQFSIPALSSVEEVLEQCLQLNQGRVFMDLWDLERLYPHETDLQQRLERLEQMNLTQGMPSST
ncbi:Radical SAM superfamily protein [Gimesia panareensis]|uniref:Radical SAM superfamily protein n=1 Tax=Gimesia panareensis TaxID=2527978 RepID=A0A517Q478_9PLAN|nr:radical SAM protein [Gimesia panareensis]QDT26430.1 Radical SAM superfamily protein [Gimesia panareensis]